LAGVIEPDFFGCSAKLSFDETSKLASASGADAGDFSRIPSGGGLVTSIDRVHRCAKDWGRFARIALNHAFGDVVCAGASPIQALLSFEFGLDASAADHAACSEAFARELAARRIALGKCHSARASGVTAVTIAALAATHPAARRHVLRRGTIRISRPIGAFKLHYLHEMGIEVDAPEALDLLERPGDEKFHQVPWSLVTDVSGHGLLGAATQVARSQGLAIELALSRSHAVSADVLSVPVECLQNPPASYGCDLGAIEAEAIVLTTLRETAGPYLGFMEDGIRDGSPEGGAGIVIGRYRRADWSVGVSWAE
jgi:hypothetical protein